MSARHVVLVGLPGAGKSTVGPLVAAACGRPFVDLDAELERRVGLSIPAQFARDGETVFRIREAELSAELAMTTPTVIAAGGGWMANPAAADALRAVSTIVYLRTAPAAALARLGAAIADRPLLARAADPLAALTALLDRRAAVYATADHVLDTDGLAAATVANSIVALVTGREGS